MELLNLFFIIGTILGLVLTIYYGRKSSALEKSKRKLDWADLQSSANDLGSRLKHKKAFFPNVIFTPGLRGATLANLLLHEFDYDIPVFVGVSSWKGDSGAISKLTGFILIETNKWFIHIPERVVDFRDKNLLIVDDFAMSGDFISKTKELFISQGFKEKNVKTMCIATTKVAIQNHKAPDYYWFETTDDDFYFPWGKAR